MSLIAEFCLRLQSNVAALLVIMPFVGAILTGIMARSGRGPMCLTALTNVWLCFGLTVLAAVQSAPSGDFESLYRPSMLTSLAWPDLMESDHNGPSAGTAAGGRSEQRPATVQLSYPRLSLAINGLNLWQVVLTVAAAVIAVRRISLTQNRPGPRLFWVLLTESALTGTLVAQDIVLMSGFNLIAVTGFFFLTGMSASPNRHMAARRFFRTQFCSGLALSLGLTGAAVSHWWMLVSADVASPVGFSLNQITGQIPGLATASEAGHDYWNVTGPWLFLLITFSILLRIALPPFHHWWLNAVEHGDDGTSALMACGYLPAGVYFAARIAAPLFSDHASPSTGPIQTWALVAAAVLAAIGWQLATDLRKREPATATGVTPAVDRVRRLIGTGLALFLALAFGAVVTGHPSAVRGGLLLCVSAAGSAGLAFHVLSDRSRSSEHSARSNEFASAFGWLAASGLVAAPVTGTFWGLLMVALEFLRHSFLLTLTLLTLILLFAGALLRAVASDRVLARLTVPSGTGRDLPGLIPLTGMLILSACFPTLICRTPPDRQKDVSDADARTAQVTMDVLPHVGKQTGTRN